MSNKAEQIMSNISAKDRLIYAAIEVFGANAFEHASTRQIAKIANVNISAITYYFGGKDALYYELIKHLANIIEKKLDEKIITHSLSFVSEIKEDKSSLEVNQVSQFIQIIIDIFLSDEISPNIIKIFMREQLSPSSAYEHIYSVINKLYDYLKMMLVCAINIEEDSDELLILAHSIFGQILIFRTHKVFFLKKIKLGKYDSALIKQISKSLLFQTIAVLDAYKEKNKRGK